MMQIDEEKQSITVYHKDGTQETWPFDSPKAFKLVSKYWLRLGWDTKYVYTFSWMGRPIIQLPEDMIRIQEVIFSIRPNIIIETGVAHGGSIIYYASLLKAMGAPGKVIGIDVEIRAHNRIALEQHELRSYFELIEGSSTDKKTIDRLSALIPPGENRILVILDSNHSKEHVLSELNIYSEFVTPSSYIVATDGIMKDLQGAPRSQADWRFNNPHEAVKIFLKDRTDFVEEQPKWLFNESIGLTENVTYWPSAYLRRMK